jgi:hypothetical protein
MRIDVNPFFARASEDTGEGDKFLQLFSPEILDVFEVERIWTIVNIIRSAPGGGKTTLLKIFTPTILLNIQKSISYNNHYQELYNILKGLGVFKDSHLNLVSSLIPFTGEYSSLDLLEVGDAQKIRLYYSLLNSRITLSILRSIAQVHGLNFPDQLDKVSVNAANASSMPAKVPLSGTGLDYYNWACQLEEHVCSIIDSVFPLSGDKMIGFDDLFVLHLFDPDNISVDGKPLQQFMLVMFDDVHNLSPLQRSSLLKIILNKRAKVNVWISERIQALTIDEVFNDQRNIHSEGQIVNRDYFPIDLEEYWRRGTKFEKFCKSVADKRTYEATDGQLNNFSGFLDDVFDSKVNAVVEQAIHTVKGRIVEKHEKKERYTKWLSIKNAPNESAYEVLKGWRSLEILLYRDQKNLQTALDFYELTEEDLKEQEGTDVRNAAALFLNDEFKIPYYFSFPVASRLGSSNIEQFLGIAGELFEDVISASILRHTNSNQRLSITATRQEEVIRRVAKEKWEELSLRIPDFDEVKPFLEALGKFCNSETYQPNAPISPGVNGIAISMSGTRTDRERLQKVIKEQDIKSPFFKLAKVLSICITYNIVEVRLNYKCKGKEFMVLYLNKILCVYFGLPLSYGGFREKKIDSLVEWLNRDFKPTNTLIK